MMIDDGFLKNHLNCLHLHYNNHNNPGYYESNLQTLWLTAFLSSSSISVRLYPFFVLFWCYCYCDNINPSEEYNNQST